MIQNATPIRVLVVDDSSFMRRAIGNMLAKDSGIKVVATGKNGIEAVKLAQQFEPDVITLDIEMPEMDGLTAIRHIKRHTQSRIIIVSSLTAAGSHVTLQALRFGADDFITKDMSQISLNVNRIEEDLLAKVHALGSQKPVTSSEAKPLDALADEAVHFAGRPIDAVFIGSSTGGPPVLEKIVSGLPAEFRPPVLIAQHMPATFTQSLSDRLNDLTTLAVIHADRPMAMKEGHIYIAQGGKHLRVQKSALGPIRLDVTEHPKEALYKPSVNELFKSAAKVFENRAMAIVLTGMGEDGLEGARELHDKNAIIIAQDHESCVVYGMPKAVTQAGLTQASLSPGGIVKTLNTLSKRFLAA